MFDKIIFEKIMKWSENSPQPKGLTNETIKKVSDYIILGISSLDYVGYIKAKNKYVIMTNGTMQHLKEFDTFNEMIMNFLELS